MLKSVMRSLIGITLIFAVAREARADVQIVKPDQPVAGQTQLFWAQAWWQWLESVPAATNPINDPTGAFAAMGNNGPVFFLAGTSGGAASAATAAVFMVFFVMAWSPFRRSNAGISWVGHPGEYANRISTTPAPGPATGQIRTNRTFVRTCP